MRRVHFKTIVVILILVFLCSSFIIIFLNFEQSSSNKPRTFLVVLITSASQNLVKRNVIRDTWLKLSPQNSRHVFVVGDKNDHNENELRLLREEIHEYGDLVLLNTRDTYNFLTSKILRSFIYLNKMWEFQFVLKCDDDSFVRVGNIVLELENRFHDVSNLYWGFFHGSAVVRRRGKWKETKWVLCDHYLPYALGGGYVLSHSLVKFIADNEHYLILFKPEDVSVGTWLAPVDVTRIHDPRFDTEYISRGCSNSYLITHKHSTDSIRRFYSNLLKTGDLCETEYKLRLSYLYNWSVEPSKCCIRSNYSIP